VTARGGFAPWVNLFESKKPVAVATTKTDLMAILQGQQPLN